MTLSIDTTTETTTVASFVALERPIRRWDAHSNPSSFYRVMGPRFDAAVARRPIVALATSLESAQRIAGLLNTHGAENS